MTKDQDRKNEDSWYCPRREESVTSVFKMPQSDSWRPPSSDRSEETCSYCGSISGQRFMELVRLSALLGATDKSYKVYWSHEGRNGKFYFQHLSVTQRMEFVELYNDRVTNRQDCVMRIDEGRFHVLPFFMGRR